MGKSLQRNVHTLKLVFAFIYYFGEECEEQNLKKKNRNLLWQICGKLLWYFSLKTVICIETEFPATNIVHIANDFR